MPGAKPLGIGKNKARRGFAVFADGSEQSVIVKAIPPIEIAVEIFCAALGRSVNLPIPEPAVIKDPSDGKLLFGAMDVGYPNFLQRFNSTGSDLTAEQIKVIAARLTQWTKLGQGVCFDELISNVDRNLQNLLWDGFDNFVMIDHGYALGLAPHGHPDQNLLLQISFCSCDDHEKKESLQGRVLSAVQEFEPELASEAALALQSAPHLDTAKNCIAFTAFLEKRFPQLAALLVRRFPSNQLRLI